MVHLLDFTRGIDEQANFLAKNRRIYLGGYVFNVGVQGSDFFSEGRSEDATFHFNEGKQRQQTRNIPLKEATAAKGLCEKDVEDTSYHRHWVTYPESRLEKEIGHEPMNAFQTCKCL